MQSPIYLLLAALLATPLTSLAASEQHDHGAAQHTLELNAGKKWATDAPLRQGMNAIRASAARTLAAAHAGKAGNADYDAFGKKVTAQVAYIVKNCKLDPKADAQLHLIIGDIMAGAEMAEEKPAGEKRLSGVIKVAQALEAYGKYFDHPGWKPLALPH